MIKIDPEFKSLIPPLSDDEFSQLEKNILKDGVRDPLVVWPQPNGDLILIDGHNRRRIIARHPELRFNKTTIYFGNREEAKRWIILNQFGRRNLSAYDRSVLALKLKPVIAEQQKQKQVTGGKEKVQQKSVEPTTTQKELAKVAGVSHDTIHKVEAIETEASPRLKEQVRSGDVSINQAYNIVRGRDTKSPARMKKEYMNKVKEEHEAFQEKKKDSVVSFDEAKEDQRNKEIIARDLWGRCMKMGDAIRQIEIERSQGMISLSEMAQVLPADKIKSLIRVIKTTMDALMSIQKEVEAG